MSKQQQQAGIVSIIVATLLIIIVSLIVLAFAQVSRREQRESLDAQLSTQAYYAAETGVNAAKSVVQYLLVNNPAGLVNQPECQPQTGPFSGITYDLNLSQGVKITCLTVNPAPTSLHYTMLPDAATVVPVLPLNGVGVNSLTFSWPKTDGFTQSYTRCQSRLIGGAYTLPTENAWNTTWVCPYAILRADFVSGNGGLSRANLLNNDKVSFMLPVASGGGAGALNTVSPVVCDDSTCSVTYGGLNSSTMYLRLMSLYQAGETVTITGTDNTVAHSPLQFSGAQASIDATGRAQDVLRRIVVSAPLTPGSNTTPTQALVSGDSVCKKFGVYPAYYYDFAKDIAGSGCL